MKKWISIVVLVVLVLCVALFTARARAQETFDGKDYAVSTEPAQPGAPQITQSIERVSDTVYNTSLKTGGQEIATAVNEVRA
jgi:uncharacterized protein YxeA